VGSRPRANLSCSWLSLFHQSASPVPTTSRRTSRLGRLGASFEAPVGELSAHGPDLPDAALGLSGAEVVEHLVEGARAVLDLERLALGLGVGHVFLRGDQLVLGSADHVGEAACGVRVARHGVVEEVGEFRPQLAQQQALADLVEDVSVLVQAELGAIVTQDAVAEGVEVMDPQPAGRLEAEHLLQAVLELGGGLDVVGQDEDVLRGEGVVALEEVADALDHDGRLARASAGQHHQRAVGPFDGRPLLCC
jgi:hypothetical protein